MTARKGGTYRGLTGPKFRPVCPACGKKGMSPWKTLIIAGSAVFMRDCRYCMHTITKDAP